MQRPCLPVLLLALAALLPAPLAAKPDDKPRKEHRREADGRPPERESRKTENERKEAPPRGRDADEAGPPGHRAGPPPGRAAGWKDGGGHPGRGHGRAKGRGDRDAENRAAERARARHGGRVLSIDAGEEGYRVKLLRDGELRIVIVEDED